MVTVASEPLALPAAREPELRTELRDALLGGAEWTDRYGSGLGIVDDLWAQWGALLEPAGMTRDELASVLDGYRREVWFWLVGDRLWDQVAEGLAGRVRRRLRSA